MHQRAIENDRKGFKIAQDAFNREYRRSDFKEQGEYHWLLSKASF